MADYAKLEVRGIYSKNSDHSAPKVDFNPTNYTFRPDEYMHVEMVCDDNGETLTTDMFTGGVTMMMVKNNDTAINVTAQFDTANDITTNVVIPPGGLFVTPDFLYTRNLILISASDSAECEVFIVGT